jgi:deoxycytidylate deaminase
VSYNGLASGKTVDSTFWLDRDKRLPYMIHAETNALSMLKKGDAYLIACTLLPCSNCAINIASHNIKKVLYKELYDRDAKALDIFDFYEIECIKID